MNKHESPAKQVPTESTGSSKEPDRPATQPSERAGTGLLAVMQSVGAAMLGVQSAKNKERDFTHGKPLHFVVGGLIGTVLFLLAVWLLVKYIIATNT